MSSARSKKPVPRSAAKTNEIWQRLQAEAKEAQEQEADLSGLYAFILDATSFEDALVKRLVSKLADPSSPFGDLAALLQAAFEGDPSIITAAQRDICAVLERDPACWRLLEPFLFFKGYAAIQIYRVAHWSWHNRLRNFARYLQARSSDVFQTDIHPAARIGSGIFLDHATGFVAGETAVIEDDVSILHNVTLGGTGIRAGKRHPTVRTGVLIGTGAQLIGDIEIGAFSKIAAGSLVTHSVPARCTAVGVPCRIVEGTGAANPAHSMNQDLAEGTYESFTYVI